MAGVSQICLSARVPLSRNFGLTYHPSLAPKYEAKHSGSSQKRSITRAEALQELKEDRFYHCVAEAAVRFSSAIEHMSLNPGNRSGHQKIKELKGCYGEFLKPSGNATWDGYQDVHFQPLRDRVLWLSTADQSVIAEEVPFLAQGLAEGISKRAHMQAPNPTAPPSVPIPSFPPIPSVPPSMTPSSSSSSSSSSTPTPSSAPSPTPNPTPSSSPSPIPSPSSPIPTSGATPSPTPNVSPSTPFQPSTPTVGMSPSTIFTTATVATLASTLVSVISSLTPTSGNQVTDVPSPTSTTTIWIGAGAVGATLFLSSVVGLAVFCMRRSKRGCFAEKPKDLSVQKGDPQAEKRIQTGKSGLLSTSGRLKDDDSSEGSLAAKPQGGVVILGKQSQGELPVAEPSPRGPGYLIATANPGSKAPGASGAYFDNEATFLGVEDS